MIGIIGAMEEEVVLLKEQLVNRESKVLAGIEFHRGVLSGKPVVVCKSGVGKVNSACAAILMVSHYGASALIFTGVAGGVGAKVQLGDTVIASDCLYHDMDATAMGWKRSEIPDGSTSVFPCDPRVSGIFFQAASSLYGAERVHRGRIVSGDQFVADNGKVAELYKYFQAYAVDMESAAVAHIAFKYHIPCCIIRSISDKSNEGAGIDYSNFITEAAHKSAQLVAHCIKAV